jgi:replicative DNA helicase
VGKYVDIPSIIQVIGGIYLNPNLLDEDGKYFFNEEDFTEEFHKILFGSIYNLHELGAKEISINAIEDYLEQRPKSYAVYKTNKGQEYLQKLSKSVQLAAFDFYYNRMKKMTLLRMYQSIGMDLSWLYDIDNIMDVKKKQAQEDWLDNSSIEDIAEIIDKKITDIRLKYVDDASNGAELAGNGALELLERLRETPEAGYPLFGPLINTVTRGARLKKFYLRSAATGVGKTRAMIADACSIACDEIYDSKEEKWISNGTKEPTIFISTEQEKDEIQTMIIAFLSDVDEEHIISGEYYAGEWERVIYAANLLKRCPLYIEQLPDFSLKDIENTIKRGVREYDVKYVFFDYIHTSMKILSEVSSKTGVRGLREDNILFMISIRLKDMCNQYGIFIMTATQLNSSYITAQQYDQNLLRGAKSIADKIDCGMIMLEVDNDDRTALENVLAQGGFETPQIKISIYKNRRGRYKGILLWCKANRGTCKIIPMFATNYQYELIPIEDLKITVKPKEEKKADVSAF